LLLAESMRLLAPLFALLMAIVVLDLLATKRHTSVDGAIDFQDTSLRVLVVTVDHRELSEEMDSAGYTSLSAVLNYNYATKHGYDYRFYHVSTDLARVKRKYNATPPAASVAAADGLRARSYHPGRAEFRDYTWSKLPVLWHIASAVRQYDLILYLDSDVAMTAVNEHRSIQEAIVHWDDSYKVVWGVKDLKKAGIMFLPEMPPDSNKPAVGAFIFRPKLARHMFKVWWDAPSQPSAADDHHTSDQRALWELLSMGNGSSSGSGSGSGSSHHTAAITASTVSLINELQYPGAEGATVDDWCLRQGWICHVGNRWAKDRHRIFRRMIMTEEKEQRQSAAANATVAAHNVSHSTGRTAPVAATTHAPSLAFKFRVTIRKIKANEIQFDLLAAAEAIHKSGGPPLSLPPRRSSTIDTSMSNSSSAAAV